MQCYVELCLCRCILCHIRLRNAMQSYAYADIYYATLSYAMLCRVVYADVYYATLGYAMLCRVMFMQMYIMPH